MLSQEPFDPLIILERQLKLTVRRDEAGSILVYGVSYLSAEKQRQVMGGADLRRAASIAIERIETGASALGPKADGPGEGGDQKRQVLSQGLTRIDQERPFKKTNRPSIEGRLVFF
ncbi:MAG: hypothetical protein V5B78_06975 [Desulfohalobiaceae bacterium]